MPKLDRWNTPKPEVAAVTGPNPTPEAPPKLDERNSAAAAWLHDHQHVPARIEPPDTDLANLVADVALGRAQVVMLAALGPHREAADVAEILIGGCGDQGIERVRRRCGQRQAVQPMPGITDLSAERGQLWRRRAQERA